MTAAGPLTDIRDGRTAAGVENKRAGLASKVGRAGLVPDIVVGRYDPAGCAALP